MFNSTEQYYNIEFVWLLTDTGQWLSEYVRKMIKFIIA